MFDLFHAGGEHRVDRLYARRVDESDYAALSTDDWRLLADFYALNRHHVLGLGRKHSSGNVWYPLPQVRLPRTADTAAREEIV